MAEEVALEEVRRDAPAVHDDEGAAGSRTSVVDRVGHQLLPGPTLALNQDSAPAGSDSIQEALEFQDGAAPSHDL